ncbi:MAG: hypothetical protein U9P00_03755, partial [Pseudomonadota bacterium]|nr:hypothetical protein [Pseudomonadota bacterium]
FSPSASGAALAAENLFLRNNLSCVECRFAVHLLMSTRYLAGANGINNIVQQLDFGVADADGKLVVFDTMFPAQAHGAFPVDQAGNIGGIGGCK